MYSTFIVLVLFFVTTTTAQHGKMDRLKGSDQGVTHLSRMNEIFRQFFPHIPEKNQIHHFNPWHEKALSPSYSSFSRFPAALPLFQQQSRFESSNNGPAARYFRDPRPLDIVPMPGTSGGPRNGLILPNSDSGDEEKDIDGFLDVLQVASNEGGPERVEPHSKIQLEEIPGDINKVADEDDASFVKIVEDRPRSMTSFGHHGLHGRKPEPAALGKRGPECMRRCIAQGVLHPVQCHSLC